MSGEAACEGERRRCEERDGGVRDGSVRERDVVGVRSDLPHEDTDSL